MLPPMLSSFLLTALLVELTPGPNMAWLALHSASQGRRARALRHCNGVDRTTSCVTDGSRVDVRPSYRLFSYFAGAAWSS
jgi:hypothetical protein